ncbi:MAG TPA: hypothetical protein VE978_22715 [Chitinophagales bacterium]|nr:hypothetical protein [Chitinophagales bacterium]
MIGFLVVMVLIIVIFIAIKPSEIISRWHHFFDEVQYSAQEYYSSLDDCIEKRKILNGQWTRKNFFETSIISARQYFRVSNVVYIFDICASPHGSGFFVSWWLRESKCLAELAFERFFKASFRKTYYEMDTQTMFRERNVRCST